jgi:ABC-type dipeptide/oligopeptide/nickel transport system permease subunit
MTTMPVPVPIAAAEEKVRSPWSMAIKRFRRNTLAMAGLVVVTLLVLSSFLSIPWTVGQGTSGVARYADQMELKHVREPPSREFWLGTDSLGRDLGARFLLGGALSLFIGISSAVIAVLIGTAVGLLAGYLGGRTDALLMRTVDLLYGLPYILLVILMRVALVGPMTDFLVNAVGMNGKNAGQWANIVVLLVGIGSVSWLTLARVVRGQVMSLRDQPFIEAARALGFPWHRIISRHILPNLVGTIVVYGTLTVPAAILSESFLSFLGLGIQAPLPSWGNLASDGTEALNPVHIRWWLITWPCVGLSIALLCLNFLGDGIRDALDPKAG